MTYEDLIAAGAPVLPAGLVYKVRKGLDNRLFVRLCRKGWLGMVSEFGLEVVPAGHENVEGVARVCAHLYRQWERQSPLRGEFG